MNIKLTKREYDVLLRLPMQNIDIADELGLKVTYIEQIVYRIMSKLHVNNRTAAVVQAIKHELVEIYNFIL
jgi:DNA-binding NarL/FixJ family response regulator